MSSPQQRHAVVTGGAQGIGLAAVIRLQAAGHAVHIFDLAHGPEKAFAEALARGAVFHPVDVTDQPAVESAFGRLPRADILVTSAGIAGPNAPTWEYPVGEWRRIMSINLDGTFHCLRAAAPLMMRNGYGRIVTVASVAGKEGNPNASAYSASKAGVIALTKSMGKELAKFDIAVNCVTPAAARTRIFDQMKQEHIDFMLSKIPRGRFLKVEEAAAMIAWLASEECSFSTGAVFDLTGGRATY
jgi:NAD(P)-dependent dehydrogenase (short-subunit alcohol dehydrogenase family)